MDESTLRSRACTHAIKNILEFAQVNCYFSMLFYHLNGREAQPDKIITYSWNSANRHKFYGMFLFGQNESARYS